VFNIYWTLGIGLIALIIGAVGGYGFESSRFDSFKEKVQAAGDVQKAEVKAKEEESIQTTKEINDAYQHDIAVIRAYFAKRVQHNPSSGSVPSLPVAPAGTNEGSPYTALIEQCVETTDQLVQLQNWVKSEEAIK
jgi:hypothetical protein